MELDLSAVRINKYALESNPEINMTKNNSNRTNVTVKTGGKSLYTQEAEMTLIDSQIDEFADFFGDVRKIKLRFKGARDVDNNLTSTELKYIGLIFEKWSELNK